MSILARIINKDIAFYINDIANTSWLQDKKSELRLRLYELIISNYNDKIPYRNEPIEYNSYVSLSDVLMKIEDLYKYNFIDDNIKSHVKQWVWVHNYYNEYNDGPWVVPDEMILVKIVRIIS